eukprot:jgi/Pico_ML_1/51978/g2761.t1
MRDGSRDVLKTLQLRGLVETTTGDEALQQHCKEKRVRVYCGFDPTADSLHLGNLLGIVVLSWFQRIMGSEVKLVNNLDWFGDMGFLEFLRKVGRYARIGTMTAKDSVKSRINSEHGMSFAEFSYQLLQGYDFVHLMDKEDVTVQIGGSDQWGNITAGTDLIRKMLKREGAHGLTFPLLVGSDGKKYDADVIRFTKMLTFLPLDEVSALEQSMALDATESLRPGSDTKLNADALESIADGVPSVVLEKAELVGKQVTEVLVSAGLQPSRSAAKRMIKGGGIRLNNVKVIDDGASISESDLLDGRLLLLAAGKKNKMLVRVGDEPLLR